MVKHWQVRTTDMHGVLAGARAAKQEEVGMACGNGSLLVEVVWTLSVLFFAPQ